MSDEEPQIPKPPGMSEEQFNDMLGGKNELMDMAASGRELFDQYLAVEFSDAQAMYFTVALLTGNPLLPPKM